MVVSNSIVSDIESRIDIVDLVKEYVPLKKSGANWKWLSPFKPEKTASFVVSPAKQIAYCFATNQWGGPLRMLMMLEKIEFREALQILAKRAGVELKTDTLQDAKSDERWTLIKLYHEVAKWYQECLKSPAGLEARNYLTKRGLTPETIEKWGIGYSDEPRDLFEKLKQKGYSEKIILESGVFVSPYKDRFFNRVMFPICNYRGEVIAFSGRTLKTDKNEAKYINSPETPIFHKSNVLFGLHLAKHSIWKEKKVVIVEGQMDVITLHQAGFDYVVGSSGTAFQDDQMGIGSREFTFTHQLRRLTNQIYLCFDRDSAGKKSIFDRIEKLQSDELDLYVIELGEAKDPDEFIKNGGDFEKAIQEAKPAVEFMIDEAGSKHDISTNQGKKSLIKDVIQHLVSIRRGSVEVDQTLRLLAKKIDVSLQTLYSEYNSAVRGHTRPQFVETHEKSTIFDLLVPYIIGLSEGREIFSKKFLFHEHMLTDPASFVLQQVLAWTLDPEQVKVEEIRFEKISEHKTLENLLHELGDIIHMMNKNYFRILQKEKNHDIQALQEFLQFGKKNNLI